MIDFLGDKLWRGGRFILVGFTATHVSVHELVMGFPIWVKLDFDTVSDNYFGSNDKEIGIIGQGHTSTF